MSRVFVFCFIILSLVVIFSNCGGGGGDNDLPTESNNTTPTDNKIEYRLDINNCMLPGKNETFEILTWNIKLFPLTDRADDYVADIIEKTDVDIIAFQEITKKSELENMLEKIKGWVGVIHVATDLNMAYIYKTEAIELLGNPYAILKSESNALPRSPYVVKVKHKSTGIETILVNNHFKCCKGTENENRRTQASVLLKKWVDDNHPVENVIILGDLNDQIVNDNNNVFQNFIDDPENFLFADMEIAEDNSKVEWSYPGFPSHIDHIIITNELFGHFENVFTFTFDNCDARYASYVSDHRPVGVVLKK